MMKQIIIFFILLLLSCENKQDKTELFGDAYSAVFESFTDLEIKNPSVSRTLAKGLDKDVIRKELNTYPKASLVRMGFDIENCISIWEKFGGRDLSAFVTDEHSHFLVPKESIIERGTRVSFSAPVFNSDTSFFYIYMVYEIHEDNKVNRSHQYLMYGKEEGSWIWMMATSYFPDN